MTLATFARGTLLMMTAAAATPTTASTIATPAAAAAGRAEAIPFDSGRWRWHAVEAVLEPHLGRPSLRLRGGTAIVTDLRATHGILEFDLAFGPDRGFVGGIWRVQDERNYEEFYLRPHQSGNPDANQYSPVWNGLSGWQLYHGERYSTAVAYPFDEWLHVRILFAGERAEIYVGDMSKPLLRVDDLLRGVAAGSIGLSAGNFAPAHFSNVSFTALETPPVLARARPPVEPPANVLARWDISESFPERDIDDLTVLDAGELAARPWTLLGAEPDGIVNLARVQGIGGGRNTALARLRLTSDRAQVRRLDFGFSDRVRVFWNGRLLFRGDDTYRSRDYRFLGSIGFFDSLYLPFVAGSNELLFALSEDVGGWGLLARLDDLSGITLDPVQPSN